VIRITVVVDHRGALVSFDMSGHASVASGPKGGNTVCAAATALARSCAEAIAHRADLVSVGHVAEGELRVQVTGCPAESVDWLRGVTAVLLTGVRRLADDAPREIELRQEAEGEQYGS